MRFLTMLTSAALTCTLLASAAAAQSEPADKEVAKGLAAAQEELTETRQALEKCQADKAAAQAQLADMTRTVEALRKELASEKEQHTKAVAKLKAAVKDAGSNAKHDAALAKLAETIKAAETLRRKLETDNALLITAAAELDQITKAAARTKADLVAAQKKLTDAKLAKTQAELAAVQKALANSQAELAQAVKAKEILAEEVATEKEQALATAAQLALATKEAARAKAELAATQKALADAKQAKTQKQLAESQKTLAETSAAADELRQSLEVEIQNSVARLKEAKKEMALLRTESKTVAAKLSAAQETLASQPPLPVTVVVNLPADAQLTFDGQPTSSTGSRREFYSPPLSVGRTFFYTLNAQVMRGGKLVTIEERIEFRAGDRINVSLTVPATAIIGRSP